MPPTSLAWLCLGKGWGLTALVTYSLGTPFGSPLSPWDSRVDGAYGSQSYSSLILRLGMDLCVVCRHMVCYSGTLWVGTPANWMDHKFQIQYTCKYLAPFSLHALQRAEWRGDLLLSTLAGALTTVTLSEKVPTVKRWPAHLSTGGCREHTSFYSSMPFRSQALYYVIFSPDRNLFCEWETEAQRDGTFCIR